MQKYIKYSYYLVIKKERNTIPGSNQLDAQKKKVKMLFPKVFHSYYTFTSSIWLHNYMLASLIISFISSKITGWSISAFLMTSCLAIVFLIPLKWQISFVKQCMLRAWNYALHLKAELNSWTLTRYWMPQSSTKCLQLCGKRESSTLIRLWYQAGFIARKHSCHHIKDTHQKSDQVLSAGMSAVLYYI